MNNSSNGVKLGVLSACAFSFMTAFFGGGWATGQMASVYGASLGWVGIIFPIVGDVFICIILWISMEYSRLNNTWNYAAFMEKFYGSKIIRIIFDVIQIVGMPITYAVSVATFASTMQQFIGGPYMMWILVFCAIIVLSVMWGTSVVNKLSAYMGTIILVLLIVVFATIIVTGNGANIGKMVSEKTMYTSYGDAFYRSAVKLYMITGGMALMVLPSLEPVQTRADVTKTVLIAFVYSAAFLFMVSFNVMAFVPESLSETVPILYAIQVMGVKWMMPIYVIIVDLAVITTGNTMGLGYVKRFSNFGVIKNWKVSERTKTLTIILVILAISSGVSVFGLVAILSVGFTYLGYLNTPLIAVGIPVIAILKFVQMKRKNYPKEKGCMEKEGSWDMFKK